MASAATIALLLVINLLFFSLVSANYQPCHPIPKPGPKPPCGGGGGGGGGGYRPYPSSCPIDTLKLSVCANVLGLVNIVLGNPTSPCCTLINGLADLEAALCLCTALKANVLGINLNVPISLSVLLNYCGRDAAGYKCA